MGQCEKKSKGSCGNACKGDCQKGGSEKSACKKNQEGECGKCNKCDNSDKYANTNANTDAGMSFYACAGMCAAQAQGGLIEDYTQPGSRTACMPCSHVLACMVRELTGFGPDLRHLGLPRNRALRLTSWKIKEIYLLREDGLTHRQIGSEVEISASYVCKVLSHGSAKKAIDALCS